MRTFAHISRALALRVLSDHTARARDRSHCARFRVRDMARSRSFEVAHALALFLGPLIAVAASLVMYSSDRLVRVAGGAFLVIAVPSMLLSFSRGGYLALAAIAVGLALSHARRRWLLAGTVTLGVLVALIPPVFHRISIEFQNTSGTTFFGRAGRLELWSATLQMLRGHLLLGAGLSGFAERIGPFWNATHPERFIDPHNIVLNFWVETGVLGLVAFAWILATAFAVTWRGWHRAPTEWHPIELGILLALVALVVHGLVDVPYFKNDLSLQFWALVGLAWAGARQSWPRDPTPGSGLAQLLRRQHRRREVPVDRPRAGED